MRIALTGASGFIGSYICKALAAHGHSVVALVRGTSRRDHIAKFVDSFVEGAQDDLGAQARLVEHADAVIHNSLDPGVFGPYKGLPPVEVWSAHLQSNLLASLQLLRGSAPRPFVYMSSISVHFDMRERWAGQIDEDHPMRPSSDYGAHKAAVESHLWAERFVGEPRRHTVALRPCGVYGIDPNLPRSHGHAMIAALRSLRSGETYKKPGGGKFVHVEDVAAAAVAALSRPEAGGMPFNLVDCYARWADWAQIACEELGINREVDMSSPAAPKNEFLKDNTQRLLRVQLDRGMDGIRTHLRELISLMP